MAEIDLIQTWQMRFDAKEMVLVLKALGGRLTKPEDVAAAKDLCDRLTRLRATHMKHLTENNEKLIANLLDKS